MSLTRSEVEDVMHPTDEPDAIESYYAILDFCTARCYTSSGKRNLLKDEDQELYDHFCTVFQALKTMQDPNPQGLLFSGTEVD